LILSVVMVMATVTCPACGDMDVRAGEVCLFPFPRPYAYAVNCRYCGRTIEGIAEAAKLNKLAYGGSHIVDLSVELGDFLRSVLHHPSNTC
jgi:hypothetical protein